MSASIRVARFDNGITVLGALTLVTLFTLVGLTTYLLLTQALSSYANS